MAALTQQCATCKKDVVGGSARVVDGSVWCDDCKEAYNEWTKGGNDNLRLLAGVLRGSRPLIVPPPPCDPRALKQKRKEFKRAVMKRTKELGLQAFLANKRVKSVQDYIDLATVHTINHPAQVLLLWVDMAVPWCVQWANMRYSESGEADSFGVRWICLYKDNYSMGTWDEELRYHMTLFDIMIENGGKPQPPCFVCAGIPVDSKMCAQCGKEICGVCRRKWLKKCLKNGWVASCPYCRDPYQLRRFVPNVSGVVIK